MRDIPTPSPSDITGDLQSVEELHAALALAISEAETTGDFSRAEDLQRQLQEQLKPLQEEAERRGDVWQMPQREKLAKEWGPKYVGMFHDGFARVLHEPSNWTFMNEQGKMIMSEYIQNKEHIRDFHDGLAAIKTKGRWNFMLPDGSWLESSGYLGVKDFSEQLAAVQRFSGRFDFIDTDGNKALPDFLTANSFHDGFALVSDFDNPYKFYFIDHTGSNVFFEQYEEARDFHEGLACVMQNNHWHFIDTQGKPINDKVYAQAGDFHEGKTWVFESALDFNFEDGYYIDTQGQRLFKTGVMSPGDFSGGVVSLGRGVFNDRGEYFGSAEIQFSERASEGFSRVTKKNQLKNFLGKDGKYLLPIDVQDADKFHDGVALVKDNGEEYYIDHHGRRVFS